MNKTSFYRITEREMQVLKLSAEGHGLKQIADMLGITIDTVDSHSRNVVDKLNARNMKHAIATAFRQKLTNWYELPDYVINGLGKRYGGYVPANSKGRTIQGG